MNVFARRTAAPTCRTDRTNPPRRLMRALIAVLMLTAALPHSARAADDFTATGSLKTRRIYHTATLLGNGKVLVAGGYSNYSAELYDPRTGQFTATGSMRVMRRCHTATLLRNGKVLVAGGLIRSDRLSSADLYDPSTGRFTPTGSLGTARFEHTATLLGNGKVLIAGGYSSERLSSAELYDPSTGLFTATGSLGAARSLHTAALLGNGKVLITGGNGNDGFLSSAELYDPSTGRFTATGSMAKARYADKADLSLIMWTRKRRGFPPFADFVVCRFLQTRWASGSQAPSAAVFDCKTLRCN